MCYKITFNRNTSVYAGKDETWNLLFLRQSKDYINDLLEHRGYVYLNQICEHLGVSWNPKCDNPCCIYNNDIFIDFGIQSVDDGFELNISW